MLGCRSIRRGGMLSSRVLLCFFFSSRRRHTRFDCDWSSDVCSSDLSGLSEVERERIGDLPRGRGLLGLVIREPKPIRSADINRHPKRYGFPPNHPPMKSFLGVPIRSRGEVFGNLYLTEKIGAKEFDVEDEAIAVLLAASTAVAIENARLHEASQDLLGQVRIMQRQRDLFRSEEHTSELQSQSNL